MSLQTSKLATSLLLLYLQIRCDALQAAYMTSTHAYRLEFLTWRAGPGTSLTDCIAMCMTNAPCGGGVYYQGLACYLTHSPQIIVYQLPNQYVLPLPAGATSFVLLDEEELDCEKDFVQILIDRQGKGTWVDLDARNEV